MTHRANEPIAKVLAGGLLGATIALSAAIAFGRSGESL
jgi:hypothetical protein